MTWSLTDIAAWMAAHAGVMLPFGITLWIAWGDLKDRRIPNYLTLSAALGGLAFNLITGGWSGLWQGFLGMLLGFAFLILPYLWGGMGAGDVKALAALGAWLGPERTLFFFCYMGIAGGLIALGVLWWRGLLWQKLRRGLSMALNLILCRPYGLLSPGPPTQLTEGIPYGVAMALGMLVLVGASA